mmetsp:Transcript_10193/g.28796  ORF Transcript_10193/g.28796 Transcript_10193/m.28796 type:complete len:129 (+) Transcript_10193:336-722(+)
MRPSCQSAGRRCQLRDAGLSRDSSLITFFFSTYLMAAGPPAAPWIYLSLTASRERLEVAEHGVGRLLKSCLWALEQPLKLFFGQTWRWLRALRHKAAEQAAIGDIAQLAAMQDKFRVGESREQVGSAE